MKYRIKAAFFVIFILLAVFLHVSLAQAQQDPEIFSASDGLDLDTVKAREEFRIGVHAFNRFAYNEAIRSFELALSMRPGEPLILDWLGRAYYRSGLENAAFMVWQAAAAGFGLNTGQGLLISSRIETLRNRRILLPVAVDDVRYVESGRYPSSSNGTIYYRHPTSIMSENDGSAWVVAYGSNEIIRIDPNGIIRARQRGPITGFDRPYDIARGPDGNLFLSEHRGNRVSVLSSDGDWQFYIGSRGRGPGQFVGPQNITFDDEGYLYVVDYGNRRISKFDPDGSFILSFGTRTIGFQGLISPTGIAASNNIIYVADNILRRIFMFDRNGFYLGVLIGEGLYSPESLRFLSDGSLLSVDSNRILLIDTDTAIIRELGVLRNPQRVRLTGADMDSNGNVLVADFNTEEVAVMTRIDDMAAGLFVEIIRVISDNFPRVNVEVKVTDRLRRPIVGLDGRNFLLSEGGYGVSEQNFLTPSYRSVNTDLSVLIERSPATLPLRDDLALALNNINEAGRIVSIVSASERPMRENPDSAQGNTPSARLAAAARGNAASYSSRWSFDQGLRLAATDLLTGEKKRAVVFVGSGGPLGIEQYSLSELVAYLSNNDVVFYAVIAGSSDVSAEIRFLAEETGGQVLSLYRNEGIITELQKLVENPSGYYALSFRSNMQTDFGRAYLPLEVEVYLMERSGRDNIGYFPPLE